MVLKADKRSDKLPFQTFLVLFLSFIVIESQMFLKGVEETDQQNCLTWNPQCRYCAQLWCLWNEEKDLVDRQSFHWPCWKAADSFVVLWVSPFLMLNICGKDVCENYSRTRRLVTSIFSYIQAREQTREFVATLHTRLPWTSRNWPLVGFHKITTE